MGFPSCGGGAELIGCSYFRTRWSIRAFICWSILFSFPWFGMKIRVPSCFVWSGMAEVCLGKEEHQGECECYYLIFEKDIGVEGRG